MARGRPQYADKRIAREASQQAIGDDVDSPIFGFCRDKDEMTSRVRYEKDWLHHQRIELFGSGSLNDIVVHLPLPDHMHHFDARQEDAGATKILEPQHRPGTSRDCPMVL